LKKGIVKKSYQIKILIPNIIFNVAFKVFYKLRKRGLQPYIIFKEIFERIFLKKYASKASGSSSPLEGERTKRI